MIPAIFAGIAIALMVAGAILGTIAQRKARKERGG